MCTFDWRRISGWPVYNPSLVRTAGAAAQLQLVCAKQAWRFLQGGSPCQERPNQPPVPSLASWKEARKEGE